VVSADHQCVHQRQIHPIDEYLTEAWLDAWTGEVVREIELYLAKHAAFDAYSADGDPPAPAAQA
jgi:hypothetical protein